MQFEVKYPDNVARIYGVGIFKKHVTDTFRKFLFISEQITSQDICDDSMLTCHQKVSIIV